MWMTAAVSQRLAHFRVAHVVIMNIKTSIFLPQRQPVRYIPYAKMLKKKCTLQAIE